MGEYNFKMVTRDGDMYVFVTRGRSKPFSDEEVEEFFGGSKSSADDFTIPSTKVFAQDLRAGLDFCASKYGVTKKAVEQKAAKVFPHLDVKQLLGK